MPETNKNPFIAYSPRGYIKGSFGNPNEKNSYFYTSEDAEQQGLIEAVKKGLLSLNVARGNVPSSELIAANFPSNSLFIRAHGAPFVPFGTRKSYSVIPSMTPRIVAKELDLPDQSRTNIGNVLLESCYGGDCSMNRWKEYFPGVTNIVRTPRSEHPHMGDFLSLSHGELPSKGNKYISVSDKGTSEKFNPAKLFDLAPKNEAELQQRLEKIKELISVYPNLLVSPDKQETLKMK